MLPVAIGLPLTTVQYKLLLHWHLPYTHHLIVMYYQLAGYILHLFIHSFIHACIRSFIHSFICYALPVVCW